MSTIINVPPGLRNVVVTETTLGDVRGDEGFYHYRQYSAIDLAKSKTLEDVWFLMFEGHLPSAAERDRFVAELAPLRVLPDEVRAVLPAIATRRPEVQPPRRSPPRVVAVGRRTQPPAALGRRPGST